MRNYFYRFLSYLSKKTWPWVFVVFARIVSAGYFFLLPLRVSNGVGFYRVLYPQANWFYHVWCVWCQFQNFTDVFFDRFMLQEFGDIHYTSRGIEGLREALEEKRGAVLLMSHMGNWEMAAHLLRRKYPEMQLLLYMGIKDKEQIEGLQKESLAKSGIRIIAVDTSGGSPLDIVDGIQFVRSGGVVSMAGDIIWRKDQRSIAVNFLGHDVRLPEAPHLFALLSGAPIFVFFAFRTGEKQYHITLSEPLRVEAASRSERPDAIRASAQRYADMLEETVRRHPLQWYHFKPFLKR